MRAGNPSIDKIKRAYTVSDEIMGRPPIGKHAMTGAERQRRYLERLLNSAKPEQQLSVTQLELAQARMRIAELEKTLESAPQHNRSQGELKVRAASRQEFGEVAKLRAENVKLKGDIFKLKAMLQEEPEATKLRKKIADQQAEMATMRRAMKQVAKERDEYKRRTEPKYREALSLLTGPNYRVIIKALHSDRSQHVSSAELAEAERLVVALRPLFIEKS
jgi:hypothetical protein